MKEARVKDPFYSYLTVSVYIVQKCNFNDEFLVEHKQIPLKELDGKELLWFDPYLGRYPESKVKIAVAKAEGKALSLLEDESGTVTERKLDDVAYKYTENYDERTLISVHFLLTSYKY